MTLGQGQRMTLTLNTHVVSFTLFSYLHLQIFRSQAGIVSEKYTVLSFSHTNAYATKVWPKIGKVIQGSLFE